MAPTKPGVKRSPKTQTEKLSGTGKARSKLRTPKAKPEVKTKRSNPTTGKKKKRSYTAEELGVPKLNGIIPAGVQKARGKKKGKVFVDDSASMLAIMGMVHAEKEGEREGKIMKARQLEEIREAKRIQVEKRQEAKKEKLEEAKDDIRRKRHRKSQTNDIVHASQQETPKSMKRTKRVSFG